MRFSQGLEALSCLLAVASASSLDDIAESGSARITQVLKGPSVSGPEALYIAWLKYNNGTAPAELAAAAKKAKGTTSAPAKNFGPDAFYLSPVRLGGTTVMLDFDTGSSDLWAFSNRLPANQRRGHSVYKVNGKATGKRWGLSYGDGSSARGVVYRDSVRVGKIGASVDVEAATFVSRDFRGRSPSDVAFDGIFGLGFPNLNSCGPGGVCKNWLATVAPRLKKNLFTATLRKGRAGEYDFGFIDKKKLGGKIAYTPVTAARYWQVRFGGFVVKGRKGPAFTGIVDTGTSLILAQRTLYQGYWGRVPSARASNRYGGVVFNCAAKLPSLSLIVNGKRRTIPGSYLNYGRISNTLCFGGLQYAGDGAPFSIIGDSFLKRFVVVFDRANKRVGFAPQK